MPDAVAAAPRETYFIAVAGSMNPAIHHLQWYRTIGAIDEAELKAALQIPINQTSALLSQVQFGSPPFLITCQPEQWWIQSSDVNAWPRMLDIAALVFARLNETPVTSYALSAQKHVDTDSPDTKSPLAETLWELNLGLPRGKSTASNITLSVIEEDFVVHTSLQASALSERAIYVFYQHLYQSPQAPQGAATGGYFDLGVLLKGRFEKFRDEQDRVVGETVASVNARAVKLVRGRSNE